VMVEGGSILLQTFIDEGLWDEARVITNTGMRLGKGIPAPKQGKGYLEKTEMIGTDQLQYFRSTAELFALP
jgi:diaminohydroxyphosphoribosylaminopyrimidine deaminase / 5-amino-6-(5-phosphoribosylamino)uracil reductase